MLNLWTKTQIFGEKFRNKIGILRT